jgi:hypothetical protein
MKRFKVPLIATAVAFVLMLIVGIVAITMITNSSGSSREKTQRAQMAGAGVATLGGICIAPFWLLAAAKLGKERREQLKKSQALRTRKSRPS